MSKQYYYVTERKAYDNLEQALKRADEIGGGVMECQMCAEILKKHGGFGPSHYGSGSCRSGSIASGGRNAHCTCDTCF